MDLSNAIRTHNHLVRKQTLKHLAKWLSFRLRTKWLWVRIALLSLKLHIWRLLRARSSLTFRQTIVCGFTLKLVRDMIITYSKMDLVLPPDNENLVIHKPVTLLKSLDFNQEDVIVHLKIL